MNESILGTVRAVVTGEDYDGFDTDLIIYINSCIAILKQIGVGPEKGFRVKDENEKWADYLPEGEILDMAYDYICTKCRLKFDPPTSGILMQALKDSITEVEQRLFYEASTPVNITGGDDQNGFE